MRSQNTRIYSLFFINSIDFADSMRYTITREEKGRLKDDAVLQKPARPNKGKTECAHRMKSNFSVKGVSPMGEEEPQQSQRPGLLGRGKLN